MNTEQSYDLNDAQSIEAFGKRLLGKNLRTISGKLPIPQDRLEDKVGVHGRASFGSLVEKYYYGITPDNRSGKPDFSEAGVELKTTPIKRDKKGGYSAKERLVLGLIDYIEEASRDFKTSSFMKKNERLMLISYLHEQGVPVGDLMVKIARLLEYGKLPPEDQKIIREDWEKINAKIRDGKAHELSEGDTLYLGACTKAVDSSSLRQQIGTVMAKPRAYAFKSGYMTEIVRRELQGSVAEDEKALKPSELSIPLTFEEIVVEKFKPFVGKTIAEVHSLIGEGLNQSSKDYHAALARRIMNVKGKRVAEFDAAEVSMKAVQLKASGMPKEHMSFPAFRYKEIADEMWDNDDAPDAPRAKFKDQIERRFFFVVFQCDGDCKGKDEKRLKKAMFWSMPYEDRREAERVWRETVRRIKSGKAAELPGSSESRVAHVRPHAKNSEDTDEAPDGQKLVKKSFWLNQSYLKGVIS